MTLDSFMVKELALATAAVFTGAAVYINLAEQPARLSLDNKALLAERKPSYARGFAMQASLALASALFGLLAFCLTRDCGWLGGALLMFAIWAYTLLVILPINKRLEAIRPEAADAETRALVEAWGKLHSGRSALGLAATIVYAWALD